jgi:uncharacterized RDD family membrane protein YckC
MPRQPGSKNRSKRVYGQQLGRWRYDGRVVTHDTGHADLHIMRVFGAPIDGHIAELDEAIKAECVRLNATVHLDDSTASSIMFARMAVVSP